MKNLFSVLVVLFLAFTTAKAQSVNVDFQGDAVGSFGCEIAIDLGSASVPIPIVIHDGETLNLGWIPWSMKHYYNFPSTSVYTSILLDETSVPKVICCDCIAYVIVFEYTFDPNTGDAQLTVNINYSQTHSCAGCPGDPSGPGDMNVVPE